MNWLSRHALPWGAIPGALAGTLGVAFGVACSAAGAGAGEGACPQSDEMREKASDNVSQWPGVKVGGGRMAVFR